MPYRVEVVGNDGGPPATCIEPLPTYDEALRMALIAAKTIAGRAIATVEVVREDGVVVWSSAAGKTRPMTPYLRT